MQNDERPVERHRRSGRMTAETPAPAPAPQPRPAPARQTRLPQAPQTDAAVERASHARTDLTRRTPQEQARQRSRREPLRVPAWLTAAAAGTLVLCLALFTVQQMMSAYLVRRAEEKREVYADLMTRHPRYFTEYIFQYADEYNLQPAFVSAIILNESSYSPTAESRLGARGLMQLMEDTAKWINDQYMHISGYSFQMMWDPETNIRFGCWYLGYLSRLFGGDPVAVTAAYHAGQSTVRSWLGNAAVSPDGSTLQVAAIPASDTREYARKVMRDYALYDALYDRVFNSGDTAVYDPDAPA